VIHAHLDHRIAVLVAQLKQHQRHADVVIEIAARGQNAGFGIRDPGSGARRLAQDQGQHFLDGGLAAAAGQTHQRHREFSAPVGAEPAQREPRVPDHDQRQLDLRIPDPGPRVFHHGGHRSGCRGLGHETMTVETLALERDEQVAALHGAAVGIDAVEGNVAAAYSGIQRARRLGDSHHRHLPLNAACAAPASLNGRLVPPISW
jgi:hypothetical protein